MLAPLADGVDPHLEGNGEREALRLLVVVAQAGQLGDDLLVTRQVTVFVVLDVT